MPKPARYTLLWSVEQHFYTLYEQGHRDTPLLQGDEESWFAWLATHTAFAFQGRHGHLNLLKERRARGREGYWYAYRRQGRRTVKQYVGRSAELSMARLEAAAQAHEAIVSVTSPRPSEHAQTGEQQTSLLLSKLRPPRLPSSLVSRERLLARLDVGLERKLTLLCAPAGFGKTTLVRQWIADRGTRLPPAAWVSLDPGDNDPVRFWRYLITACQIFQADLGESALRQLSTAFLPSFKPFALEAVLTGFLNELTHRAPHGVLILEDYHALASPQVERTMTFFLDHLPTTLHLVILTQRDPSLPLARLRARDDLCELRAADLCFSQEEMTLFLQHATAIIPATLSPETFRSLTTRLEGWAAGLRLLALALQGRTKEQEVEQVLATFAGDHPSLQDYFVSEVLHRQSEATQDFLLRTSVLSRLTGSLCDALTGRLDSASLLVALDRAGFFLEQLDGSEPWYRYHALFAEAMQVEARRRFGEERVRSLSLQASRWYAEHDLLTEAVEAALEARNFAFAAGLIERIEDLLHLNFTESSTLYDFRSLFRWLEQIPDTLLRQRPALCLVSAAALLLVSLSDQHSVTRVLATCGIRPSDEAFENTQSRLLLLADFEEEEYNLKHSPAHLHKGVTYTVHGFLTFIKRLTGLCLKSLHHRFVAWTKPGTTSLMLGVLTDLARSKSELMAENALLRQQLIILRRQVKRSPCTKTDRMLLVLLARMVRTWKQALFIVQPETLLRWHRQGFKLYWKYKSRAASAKPKISAETVALIKEMASNNRLWGAERIRGELLKLGLHVCKRTVQKYMRPVRTARPRGQKWSTFLHTHAEQIWACDFLPVNDLFFRSLFAFFIIELQSRKVIHVGVTRCPTDAWTAQQLREATAYGEGPKYLIRDNDGKFGVNFARVAKTSRIEILKTPYHAPQANAICERFLGSVRRECLDHLLILHEKQLQRVLNAYVHYFNRARPHQGIKQQIPEQKAGSVLADHADGKVLAFPVLGGLHHDYRRSV